MVALVVNFRVRNPVVTGKMVALVVQELHNLVEEQVIVLQSIRCKAQMVALVVVVQLIVRAVAVELLLQELVLVHLLMLEQVEQEQHQE